MEPFEMDPDLLPAAFRSNQSHGSLRCMRGAAWSASPSAWVLLLTLGTLVTAMGARLPLCGPHEFLSNGRCQPCRQCPPGEEQNQVCGHDYGEGTTCEACPPDYYSDKLGYDKCQPRIDCEIYNAKTQTAGDEQHDTVCGDCLPGFYHCSLLSPNLSNKYDKYECCDCRSAKTAFPECRVGFTTAKVRMPHAVQTPSYESTLGPLFYSLLGVLLLLVTLGMWVSRRLLRRSAQRFVNAVTSRRQSRICRCPPSQDTTLKMNLLPSPRPPEGHRRHSIGPRFSDTLKNCKCEYCRGLMRSFEAGEFQRNYNSIYSPYVLCKKKMGNTPGMKPINFTNSVKEESDSDDFGLTDSGPVPWVKTVKFKRLFNSMSRRSSVGSSTHSTVSLEPERGTRRKMIECVEEMYGQALKKTKDMAIDALDFRLREKLTLKLNSSINSGGTQQNLLSKLGYRMGITGDDVLLLSNADELLRVAGTRAASVPSLLEALHDVKHYDILNLLCKELLSPDDEHDPSSI